MGTPGPGWEGGRGPAGRSGVAARSCSGRGSCGDRVPRSPPGAGGARRPIRGSTPSHRGRGFSLAPSALEPLAGITYNAVDGPIDRRSFHGVYAVQDGLPL